MIKRHTEIREVLFVFDLNACNVLLRRHAHLLRRQHDRRAVRVIRTDEVHFLAFHPHRTHPNVRLDVTKQVAEVQWTIRIGKGAGNENL